MILFSDSLLCSLFAAPLLHCSTTLFAVRLLLFSSLFSSVFPLSSSSHFISINFCRRFCSNLGMTNQAVKAAQEAVQKSEV
ncbi:hypothetical protein RIF29_13890 [Crotalaria pallida]|uniref:Uncharacterized protein n=1 Tax=Crotalaria pallida TaxID=3830 RepID=A0AAN9FFT1_CROPI